MVVGHDFVQDLRLVRVIAICQLPLLLHATFRGKPVLRYISVHLYTKLLHEGSSKIPTLYYSTMPPTSYILRNKFHLLILHRYFTVSQLTKIASQRTYSSHSTSYLYPHTHFHPTSHRFTENRRNSVRIRDIFLFSHRKKRQQQLSSIAAESVACRGSRISLFPFSFAFLFSDSVEIISFYFIDYSFTVCLFDLDATIPNNEVLPLTNNECTISYCQCGLQPLLY